LITISSIKGVVRNLGICYPADDDTLQVEFTGGTLTPQLGQDLVVWKEVFNQGKPANKGLKDWFMSLFLKVMFGLVPPNGMNEETGEISFQMKRSPKGKLSILYLDEEMRITKEKKALF
jgi:hypothetical protein